MRQLYTHPQKTQEKPFSAGIIALNNLAKDTNIAKLHAPEAFMLIDAKRGDTAEIWECIVKRRPHLANTLHIKQIAAEVGCDEKTVRRAMEFFCSLGLLNRYQLYRRAPIIYTINASLEETYTWYSNRKQSRKPQVVSCQRETVHSKDINIILTLKSKKQQTASPRSPAYESLLCLPNAVTRRRLPEIVTTYMGDGFLNKGSPGDLTRRLLPFDEIDCAAGFNLREFEEFLETYTIATA